jgi:carbon storage regulator CsrA
VAVNVNRAKVRSYRARDPVIKRGLMLQRRVGEKIIIGDDIEITLMSTEGPSAQIHIHAPRQVQIDRAERRPRGRT